MELTITQNGALYFAHHKVSKRRAGLFWLLRTAANEQALHVRDLLDSGQRGSSARR